MQFDQLKRREFTTISRMSGTGSHERAMTIARCETSLLGKFPNPLRSEATGRDLP
jgi:hypothetical protein